MTRPASLSLSLSFSAQPGGSTKVSPPCDVAHWGINVHLGTVGHSPALSLSLSQTAGLRLQGSCPSYGPTFRQTLLSPVSLLLTFRRGLLLLQNSEHVAKRSACSRSVS